MTLRRVLIGLLVLTMPSLVFGAGAHFNTPVTISNTLNHFNDGGANDTYAGSLNGEGFAGAAYVEGSCVTFTANTANTGVASLNVNAIGAAAIKKMVGGTATDLATNDICVDQHVRVCFVTDYWQMTSPTCNVASGGVSDGDKGDITISASGATYTIDNDVVTYAKMQNVSATDRLLGRDTAGAGDVEELDATAVKTMLALNNVDNTADASKNVATAAALAANPANCTVAGAFGNGINASGVPENCVTLSAVNAQTSTYQVLAADFDGYKTITVASGTFTITLVASGAQPVDGKYIDIINYGSGVVTIARSGQNINGGTASLTLPASSATAPSSARIISNGTNYFADVQPAGGVGLTDGDKGDITVSSTGTVWTIDNDVVTYAKMQDVSATDRLLGRDTAGAGNVEELDATAVKTMLGLQAVASEAPASDDQVYVSDSTSDGTWRAVPNCADTSGQHLNYTAATNSFSCGTSGDGVGGGAGTPVALSHATGTVNAIACSTVELYYRHDMSGAIVIQAFTGTCTDGQIVKFRLKPNTGGALGLTFNTGTSKSFSAENGLALPTTTFDSTLYVEYAFMYNATSDRFGYLGGTKSTAPLGLADGGTGSALTDPGAHRLWGWDDTNGDIRFFTIGGGLSYDAGTDTVDVSTNIAKLDTANSWADGVKQTFNPNGTTAGVNVGSQAGDPSTPANGDLWYDSTANELTARINGANVALGAGGGGGGDVGTGQSNTWTTGAQDMGAATSFIVPKAAGAAPTADGDLRYDTTRDTFVGGAAQGGTHKFSTVPCVTTGTSANSDDSGSGAFVNHTLTCDIPANGLQQNAVYRVTVFNTVVQTNNSPGTLTHRLQLDAVTAFTNTTGGAPTINTTRSGAVCFLLIGLDAPGAAANVMATGCGVGDVTHNFNDQRSNATAITTHATNSVLTVTYGTMWATNVAGANTSTQRGMMLEKLN